MNYGVTYRQMEEDQVSLDLLYDLIANIRYMADKSKSGWDSAWVPTSFFKRSRAVSSHMVNRADRIVTSIFGRRLSWWDKMSSSGDDYDPFGSARKKKPKGIEREIADQEIAKREAQLHQENPAIAKYSTAQDHPGLTYDPELLPESARVMSGRQYDRLVALEAGANRQRAETEQAVRGKRSDLLVPMQKEMATPTESTQVATAQRAN